MNIDELKFGELKEIANLFGNQAPERKADNIYDRYIGKYVICRTRNEGINAGKVIALDETGVILEDARRLYYHEPKDKSKSWYEGVAESGLNSNSKVGVAVEKIIVEDYSLTICSDIAEESIREAKNYEQS